MTNILELGRGILLGIIHRTKTETIAVAAWEFTTTCTTALNM